MIEERMNEMESRSDAHYTDTSPNRPSYVDLWKIKEYWQLVRAFRLKHFGRCPKCDSVLIRDWEKDDFYCLWGHFRITFCQLYSAPSLDEFYYDLCKEEGGKNEHRLIFAV